MHGVFEQAVEVLAGHRRQGNESTLEICLKHSKHVIPNVCEESVIYFRRVDIFPTARFRQILHCVQDDKKGRYCCETAHFAISLTPMGRRLGS